MSYLIILLVLAVAVSPLLSMMPSRRQRALAELRQAAASSGLYVELLRAQEERGRLAEPPAPPKVLYGCRRQRGDKPGAGSVHYCRQPGGWEASAGHWPQQDQALLEELPSGVLEIKEDFLGIGVIWDESGAREDVEKIARILRKLLGRHY